LPNPPKWTKLKPGVSLTLDKSWGQRHRETTGLRPAFDTAAPSGRKEWVRQVTDAKTEDTRARRVAKVVAEVAALAGRG
jgi:uncharacterized protein YdeI (YjbR/CyaY-like superfamily)